MRWHDRTPDWRCLTPTANPPLLRPVPVLVDRVQWPRPGFQGGALSDQGAFSQSRLYRSLDIFWDVFLSALFNFYLHRFNFYLHRSSAGLRPAGPVGGSLRSPSSALRAGVGQERGRTTRTETESYGEPGCSDVDQGLRTTDDFLLAKHGRSPYRTAESRRQWGSRAQLGLGDVLAGCGCLALFINLRRPGKGLVSDGWSRSARDKRAWL